MEDPNPSQERNLDEQKEISFHSAVLSAWTSSKMEKDKSLLTLSAGGVGLLVTFIVNFGIKSQAELITYIVAIGGFLICIASTLFVFERNAKYLEEVYLKNKETDSILQTFDRVSSTAFMIAVVFLILAGACTVFRNEKANKENTMPDTPKKTRVTLNDSVEGISRFRPADQGEKSLNGIAQFRPSTNQTQSGQSSSNSDNGSSGSTDKK